MQFTWDEAKNAENLARHGLSFETASLVFEDPVSASVLDPCEHEERWRTIGVVAGIVVILVVHTVVDGEGDDGEELIRIISARKATTHERRAYEESQ